MCVFVLSQIDVEALAVFLSNLFSYRSINVSIHQSMKQSIYPCLSVTVIVRMLLAVVVDWKSPVGLQHDLSDGHAMVTLL